MVRRSIFQAALVVGPPARAYCCLMPAGNSKGEDRGRSYRLGRSYQSQGFQLGRCGNTAGGSMDDPDAREVCLVLAFVIRGAGNAGCPEAVGSAPAPLRSLRAKSLPSAALSSPDTAIHA
jgi:hypothetical protein